VTRYKVELEVAMKDGDLQSLEGFKTQLNRFAGDNVPAHSGWASTRQPIITEIDQSLDDAIAPWRRPVDPRWKALLDKIDEMVKSGKPLATRSSSRESGRSGAHKGSLHCDVTLYDDRSCETKSLYLLEASEADGRDRRYPKGTITVRVQGPYEDASDEYWIGMANRDKVDGDAIITEDWVHRTVSKDNRDYDRDLAGHGGAEFRFEFLVPGDHVQFKNKGLRVLLADEEDNNLDGPVLVTRNCWYQGKIPAKHRHLFRINAKMVKGFNPGVNV
jgi:hypothetical protein